MKKSEVLVQFNMEKLGPEGMKHLFDAEASLRKAGITFDTGAGFGSRDWEWDFSLSGPIEIYHKRFKGEDEDEEKDSN